MIEQGSLLTFIELTGGKSPNGHLLARYSCACGEEAVLAKSRVQNGYTRSCGCLVELARRSRGHGMSDSGTYRTWIAMRRRCLNPSDKDYDRWGGSGITICDRWGSFAAFFEDVGERPDGTTLDRIDARLGYFPENVRWATPSEQQRNRTDSVLWHIKGQTFDTSYEAADHFGVTSTTVCRWVHGSFDRRRNKHTAPKEDCYVTPIY